MLQTAQKNQAQNIMPAGPFKGQMLSPRKRAVQSEYKNELVEISNIRLANQWWTMTLNPSNIQTVELLGQQEKGVEDKMHVMLRVVLATPAKLSNMDNNEVAELQDFILTVNPHEADGQTSHGRVNNVHTVAFRIVPTAKLVSGLKKNPNTLVYSETLNLSQDQKIEMVLSFLEESNTLSGKSLFHYTQNNCSTHLWGAIFKALNVNNTELSQLATRGKNAFIIAEKMGMITAQAQKVEMIA